MQIVLRLGGLAAGFKQDFKSKRPKRKGMGRPFRKPGG
jgi:hypothetical protein